MWVLLLFFPSQFSKNSTQGWTVNHALTAVLSTQKWPIIHLLQFCLVTPRKKCNAALVKKMEWSNFFPMSVFWGICTQDFCFCRNSGLQTSSGRKCEWWCTSKTTLPFCSQQHFLWGPYIQLDKKSISSLLGDFVVGYKMYTCKFTKLPHLTFIELHSQILITSCTWQPVY